jgi:hypothetical protein
VPLSPVWNIMLHFIPRDRLCGLVVRVVSYRSGGQGSIPGTTRKKSSGSGTGSTQPRDSLADSGQGVFFHSTVWK